MTDVGVWSVEFSSPSVSKYRYNGTVTVISPTLRRALELVQVAYPDAAFHAAHKRSRGELISDPQVQFVIPPTEESQP